MKTRTILIGLLVTTGCRTTSLDTATPGDAPEPPLVSKAPSDGEATAVDDIDMDDVLRDDTEEDASSSMDEIAPADYEDVDYEDDDVNYEDDDEDLDYDYEDED